MSKALLRFIDEFGDLQGAAVKRKDRSFATVEKEYYKRLQRLAEDQTMFKKNLRNMSSDEKREVESELKSRFNDLTQDRDWVNINSMKDIFYNTIDSSLSQWLMDSYKDGTVSKAEDIKSRLVPAIDDFNWLMKHNVIKKEKVTRFDGLRGLEDFLSKEDVQKELQKRKGVKRLRDEDAELIHETQTYKVYHPKTQDAACYLGQGTKWCTAATKGANMFETYDKDGPLYVIQPKMPEYNGEKYQLHLESNSFMNEKDHRVSIVTLKKRFPGIEKVLKITPKKEIEMMLEMLQEDDDYIVYDNHGSPEILYRGELIGYVVSSRIEELMKENPDADPKKLEYELDNDELNDEVDRRTMTVSDIIELPENIRDELIEQAELLKM